MRFIVIKNETCAPPLATTGASRESHARKQKQTVGRHVIAKLYLLQKRGSIPRQIYIHIYVNVDDCRRERGFHFAVASVGFVTTSSHFYFMYFLVEKKKTLNCYGDFFII